MISNRKIKWGWVALSIPFFLTCSAAYGTICLYTGIRTLKIDGKVEQKNDAVPAVLLSVMALTYFSLILCGI